MSNSWQPINFVSPGDPVSAGVVNQPSAELAQRTELLNTRVEAGYVARANFDYDVPCSPDCLPGMVVYWNSTTQRYEPALATVVTNSDGTLQLADSAVAAGLVFAKRAGNTIDVALSGIVALAQLTNAIGSTILPGSYYLSTSHPGALVQQQPPISVFICQVLTGRTDCNDVPDVLIRPQVRDPLLDHTHYRFPLVALPAGTVNAPSNGRQTINEADPMLAGWLPANHASFQGRAPRNAVFGYNLEADLILQNVWPPVPITSVAILWDKGDRQGAVEIPLGPDGLVICDTNGIWWLSDCFGDTPWPADYNNDGPLAEDIGSESIAECPRFDQMRIEVCFLRMLYGNNKSVVTTIRPAHNSPIVVTGCATPDGETGDIELDLDLSLSTSANTPGHTVVKSIGNDLQVQTGIVLEGLLAGNDNVQLSSSTTRPVDPTDDASATLYQGVVTVAVLTEPGVREIQPQLIRLDAVEQRYFDNLPAIAFLPGRSSSARLSFALPAEGMPTSPIVKIRFWLFGRTNGTLPAMTVTYRRMPPPTVGGSAVALPTDDTSINITTGVAVTANNVIAVETDAIPVAPGELLFVSLNRSVGAGYTGEVQMLRAGAMLQTGA